jgi:hypothetical protein
MSTPWPLPARGVFIPINDWKILQKHFYGLVDLDYQESTKAEILEGLRMRLTK